LSRSAFASKCLNIREREVIEDNFKFVCPSLIEFPKEYKYIIDKFEDHNFSLDEKEEFSFACKIKGSLFNFGVGGLHAANQGTYVSDEKHVIVDIDFSNFYPFLYANPKHKELQLVD
jgi:hypothetical protein